MEEEQDTGLKTGMQRRGGPGTGGVAGGAPAQREAAGRSQARPCPDRRADWAM